MPKSNLTGLFQDDNDDQSSQQQTLIISKPLVPARGQVRVAKYYPGKPPPKMENYKTILIHIDSKPLGGQLSPYVLANAQGCLLENVFQFSKAYSFVKRQEIPLSRWHPDQIIWSHPAEQHIAADGTILDAYWAWRAKGMRNPKAVRYPNGYHGRSQVEFSLWPKPGAPCPCPDQRYDIEHYDRLDYIEARKRIYCQLYADLAPATDHYQKLMTLLASGENLLICEVDGPDPTLEFAPYDQISIDKPGLLINEDNIRLLINDPRKPFGHGYAIAALLCNGQEWMN